MQLDEKWSYVYKKQAHCDPDDPADDNRGDWWDHTAYDPEHRLVLCVVPGARGAEEAEAVVADVKERTEGRTLRLMTSDDYPAYETAIEQAYGEDVTTTPSGRPSGDGEKGCRSDRGLWSRPWWRSWRHLRGDPIVARGPWAARWVSRRVNVSFLERYNATDRHKNARKVRKTYTFSKDWRVHESMTYFTMYSYNFCWAVRTLAYRDEDGRVRKRSPAMAAGLADHVWTMREWITMPSVQCA